MILGIFIIIAAIVIVLLYAKGIFIWRDSIIKQKWLLTEEDSKVWSDSIFEKVEEKRKNKYTSNKIGFKSYPKISNENEQG